VDTYGHGNEKTLQSAKNLGFVPFEGIAGSVRIDSSIRSSFPQKGIWAYSVDRASGNSEHLIDDLLDNILNTIQESKSHKISIPLLGTGGGKLDHINVARMYVQNFSNGGPDSPEFVVSVLSEEHFRKIVEYLQATASRKAPDLKSRLHSDVFNIDEKDILQYNLIAQNLFTILTDKDTNPPLNIGILAPWGRGKTSLMKRLQQLFDKERIGLLQKEKFEIAGKAKLSMLRKWLNTNVPVASFRIPYPTVWFNPWNYQSTNMVWAGLGNAIIEQVVAKIPGTVNQELFWLQLRLSRIDKQQLRQDLQKRFLLATGKYVFWGIAAIVGVLLWLWQPYPALWGILGISGLGALVTTLQSFLKPYNKLISEVFDTYTRPPKYNDSLGTFHDVQSDMNNVMDICIDEKRPLIVFVDDLDRCSPSTVVEVIEAINVFISGQYNRKCYFIMGMDAEMVAAALDVSYEKMRGRMGSREQEQGSVGWYFMDKFIQLPFFIPVLSETKKKDFLSSLLDEAGETVESKKMDGAKVEGVVQEVMSASDSEQSSRIIKDAGLTAEEKKEMDRLILEQQVKSGKLNAEIKNQVGLYAKFISADPRSLKRFTNLLRFYASYQFLRMKKGEKFVETPVLAKWLALMVKFPQLIRWIQWDAENKSAMSTAEAKASIIDQLVETFIQKNKVHKARLYDQWLELEVPKEFLTGGQGIRMKELDAVPWLRSKDIFDLLMKEAGNEGRLKNALDCNVW
jgi:hypothetical protein